MAAAKPAPGIGRRWVVRTMTRVAVASALVVLFISVRSSCHYDVPLTVAIKETIRETALAGIRLAIAVYDPYSAHLAATGPDSIALAASTGYMPIEHVLIPGGLVIDPAGNRLATLNVHNEAIIRGPGPFAYQPYDEVRLHELRDRYDLGAIVARAPDEFSGMVQLRNWTRSQFRRSDYQPTMVNFDALQVLNRGLRNHGEPLDKHRHIDPCHFFPLLYCQVMLSVGHQARLMSANGHGSVEVWSNQFKKWVLMDAELNQHLEKDGIPLNMGELLDENYIDGPTRVRVIRGQQTSDENTTMAHLRVPEIAATELVTWYKCPLNIVDMRNDWMTNHYFRGHPARSERNSLIYLDPRLDRPVLYDDRLRPVTRDKETFYWTLNQVHIQTKYPDAIRQVSLHFDTVTPNYQCYEYRVDNGEIRKTSDPTLVWKLHPGKNSFSIRAVNLFGIRGPESGVELAVGAGGN
jgi:hypothetical protein